MGISHIPLAKRGGYSNYTLYLKEEYVISQKYLTQLPTIKPLF